MTTYGSGVARVDFMIISLAGAPDNSVEFSTSEVLSWIGSVHLMTFPRKKRLNYWSQGLLVESWWYEELWKFFWFVKIELEKWLRIVGKTQFHQGGFLCTLPRYDLELMKSGNKKKRLKLMKCKEI